MISGSTEKENHTSARRFGDIESRVIRILHVIGDTVGVVRPSNYGETKKWRYTIILPPWILGKINLTAASETAPSSGDYAEIRKLFPLHCRFTSHGRPQVVLQPLCGQPHLRFPRYTAGGIYYCWRFSRGGAAGAAEEAGPSGACAGAAACVFFVLFARLAFLLPHAPVVGGVDLLFPPSLLLYLLAHLCHLCFRSLTPQSLSLTQTLERTTSRTQKGERDTFSRKHDMSTKMNEVSVDDMFKLYIPGDDPSSEAQSKFVSIAIESEASGDDGNGAADTKEDEPAAAIETKPKVVSWVEWHCMIEICKISKSVVEAAQSVGPEPSEPLFMTYDTSNWPVQPGIKPEGDCKTDDEATELEDMEDLELEGPEEEKAGDRLNGGVYAVNSRTEQFVAISDATLEKKSKIRDADKQVRAGFVGHCSWADLMVPIKVKVDRSRAAFTFADRHDHFLLNTDNGTDALEQILEYGGHVFTHQHRTHVYALYVFRHQARILYFDRSGCILSEPFQYGTGIDTPLHRFFWRLAHISNEQRGYDRTAVLASEDEVKQTVEYAQDPPTDYIGEQIYHALSWDSENGAPRSTQWPAYKVTMANRALLIARPMASTKSLHGRCTRGYIAYDLKERTVSFLKDFWRQDSPRVIAEHEVYKRLAAHKVSNIATCDDSEDVRDAHGQWQVTKIRNAVDHKSRLPFGHYRIRLREVCRPVIDFKDFRELASLLYDAMIEGKGKEVTRRGLLNDWDVCKYREQMDESTTPRRPNLTGTWYFRSALSLQCPYKPYRISDDIESFVHVYHYCVYRFQTTNAVHKLANIINATYGDGENDIVDGVTIGGSKKLMVMMYTQPPMEVDEDYPTLADCLVALHEVYNSHYKAINLALYKQLYRPSRGKKLNGRPVPEIIEDNTKPLDTHSKLKDVFSLYGGRVKGELGNPTIVWGEKELQKAEDLFEHTSLAERKNTYAAFFRYT
ncbi:hypothetical protein EVG20_g6936 [Dentipellis fragilis]|uniref:Fungal-type protein kinase domain-containing protein n=1 Tax=Dentipellis fragilis TaxID=205917 RepID=A0A4Y9YGR9_9AGAM|nr:hypothetical protein EVG20_g6936 [Dentipellis fragilis]